MPIQYNKVTWYSIVASILVFIGTLFVVLHITEQYKELFLLQTSLASITSPVSPNGDVVLGLYQIADYKDLELSFDGVTQDNRCPVDVECIEAGAITARVSLNSSGHSEERNFTSDEVPYIFGQYAISIVRVAPEASSTLPLDRKKYVIVFHIDKVSPPVSL
ncbi:TPA: hypothetical protein DCQ44_00720 [Candidatus Taylorbacteria bacterium]|nr:hypothetical protein [Candidatus Taylorbacteria bacterium]